MNRLAGFVHLSRWERHVLLQALVLLPLIALRIRWFGLRRAFNPAAAAPRGASSETGDLLARARRIAHLVDAAARHGPFHATCLPRSLTLHRLLRERGIEAHLRLGVRKIAGSLEAHAWIERDGEPLIESAQIDGRFAAFAEPVKPRAGESR